MISLLSLTISSGSSCRDHFTRATQDDWRCATQGALAQWCALCGGMAWTCISINIFLLVVAEMKPQNALKLQKPYILAIFLMPSISILFIALPGGFMESSGVLAWCDAGSATQWVAQVPYAVQVLITLICILSVVIKLLLVGILHGACGYQSPTLFVTFRRPTESY